MIGVDEVGRGCWAGPLLVVAARPTGELPSGLKDSKLLSKKQRQQILNLLSICCEFGEGWVSPAEIDQHGLTAAMRLGVARALAAVKARASEKIIIDGNLNYADPTFKNALAVINADESTPTVSAASVYAKVKRDAYMAELSLEYPEYQFEKHVGYGTVIHKQALIKHGLIESVHRLSFKPIAELS